MKIAIIISGRGSNMLALAKAVQKGDIPGEIVCVIANKPDAAGLEKARALGLKTEVIDHRTYDNRDGFEDDLHACLKSYDAGLVCLAGFMRLLGARFVNRWKDRLINVHPSLLPSYKGLDTHNRVLEDGVPLTGCTIHYVRPDMDSGPIIAQAVVPVAGDDDADSLAARVLKAENALYPAVVAAIARGRVRVSGTRVRYSDYSPPLDGFSWPVVLPGQGIDNSGT